MAGTNPTPRRKPRENQYIFDLGVRGRKTGLTVPDSGIRDEHGLEPMDDLFSSPEKAPRSIKAAKIVHRRSANATVSDEEDMDMGQSTIPEPTAVLTERKRASIRMPPPRSKSPIKTFLQSPARRNPSLGPVSSPMRGSIVSPNRATVQPSVNRRLDFSTDGQDRNPERAAVRSPAHKRPGRQKPTNNLFNAKLTNGTRISPLMKVISSPHEGNGKAQAEPLRAQDDHLPEYGNDSYQVMDDDYGEVYEEVQYEENVGRESSETDIESPLQAAKKSSKTVTMREPLSKHGKRKAPSQSPGKTIRIRPRDVGVEDRSQGAEGEGERPTKKARGRAKKVETSSAGNTRKSRAKAAARSLSPTAISSPPEIHRAPPRPQNNRGLYILRRETPNDGFHTRSGRNVIKPVAYWKNETIVYGDDEEADGDASFLLPTIKEVIRRDESEQPKSRKRHGKGGKVSRKSVRVKAKVETDSDEEDLVEPWELEPGRVHGAIRTWNPEDPIGEDSIEKDEELALSSAAIITRDIPGATFKFAKTLTLPFFGSGMVDLPPGAVKKTKNSRRMQMVFFVFSGRVSVTVNDNTFRIGKGGMWQVPRGNFYSIENDYDNPARIFFSQACEIAESAEG